MIYSYKCKCCGREFDKAMPLKDMRTEWPCECGGVAKRNYRAEHTTKDTCGSGWPMVSDAAGVSPEGAPKVKADMARHGIHCDFDCEGRPIFRNPSHRNECLKYFGLVDKASYY